MAGHDTAMPAATGDSGRVLARCFAERLETGSTRTAVSDPRATLDYRRLDEATRDVARLLTAHRRTVHRRTARRMTAHRRPDDRQRVGVVAANSVGYVVCYIGILRAGGVPFLIDAATGPDELARLAGDCSLDLLVHDDRDLGDLGDPGPAPVAGLSLTRLRGDERRYELLPDTEVCRFTSGSTGRSHCIEFSGRAVVRAAANWARGTDLGQNDRIACFAALSNGLAFNTSLLSTFLAGASLHLGSGLPTASRVTAVLRRHAATRLVGFPALYQSLLRRGLAAELVAQIEVAISSAAPLPAETRNRFHAVTGIPISNYYGVAEAGPLTFTASPGPDGDLGPALPGVGMRAGGDADAAAEIQVVSESMGSRYLNAPGGFESRLTPDGYFRTGDQGYLRDGLLFLTGRTTRYINVAGRKVDPVEVTAALRQAPGVRDAVVFDTVDPHGETQVAAAVASDAALDADLLRRHCAARLTRHKVPARIHVLPEIPVNSIGKPSLEALRRLPDVPEKSSS